MRMISSSVSCTCFARMERSNRLPLMALFANSLRCSGASAAEVRPSACELTEHPYLEIVRAVRFERAYPFRER